MGSGELHSIQDILEIAFGHANLDWHKYVVLDEKLKRNVEYANLCGDIGKISKKLDWRPRVSFRDLIESMVDHDIKLFSK